MSNHFRGRGGILSSEREPEATIKKRQLPADQGRRCRRIPRGADQKQHAKACFHISRTILLSFSLHLSLNQSGPPRKGRAGLVCVGKWRRAARRGRGIGLWGENEEGPPGGGRAGLVCVGKMEAGRPEGAGDCGQLSGPRLTFEGACGIMLSDQSASLCRRVEGRAPDLLSLGRRR